MNLTQLKDALNKLDQVKFRLPNNSYVPNHFHVTEVGLVKKHFIDCGGMERTEQTISIQLWEAGDYDHRLAPQKFLRILELSRKILHNVDNLEIEVEYQQETICKFSLDFDGIDFVLSPKFTACLAQDSCGIPPEKLSVSNNSCCSGKGGCC